MALRVAFTDMWSQFNPRSNFLQAMLSYMVIGGVEIVKPEECDTLIYSVFGHNHRKYRDKFRIFFTGENVRPPLNDADFCVSFDFDARNYGDVTSTNYRLPLWWCAIDWFRIQTDKSKPWAVQPEYLDRASEFTMEPKTKFCAAVFAKQSAYRMETLAAFEKHYKKIDAYGGPHPNKIPAPDYEYNKLRTLSQYKFSMCYENSSYPGYVTEKLMHAKVAGTVPIYWGNQTFAMDFNPKCCVFFDGDYDKLVAEVRRLDENDAAYAEIASQPLFLKLPDVNMGAQVFHDIFRRRFALDTPH